MKGMTAEEQKLQCLVQNFMILVRLYELYYDGPFKYTLRGEMEGHIVIGVELIDKAIRENPSFYS